MPNELSALIVAGAVVALPALYVLASVAALRAFDALFPDRREAQAGPRAAARRLPKAA